MKKYGSVAVLLCAALLSSCDKNAVQAITGVAPGASVKFFNFGVNAPGVNFFVNDTKVTATLSASGAVSPTGTVYGGVGDGGFYEGVVPGASTLTGKIADTTTNPNLTIATVTATLVDGKYYSFYMSGFYNTTTKTVESFFVEDPFIATTDFTVAYVRFVNAISNANPMTLYAKDTTTAVEFAVGAAVAYKAAGAFTALPSGIYNLNTRFTGSATNAITRTGVASVTFLAGKVYTISARGDITVVSTTATNRPFLDNTLNR